MRILFATAVCLVSFGSPAFAQSMQSEMSAVSGPNLTIAASIAAAPGFKMLSADLEAAGLTETLSGSGPFTLLAPTDEAFAALPKELVEEMLKPENKDALAKALLCHVIEGKLVSNDLTQMEAAGTAGPDGVIIETLGGCKLTIKSTAKSGLTVTDENGTVARVTVPDLPQSNGVVHVIDTILRASGM